VPDATVPTVVVRADRYFDRDTLYGPPGGDYPDNAERFAFFCRAALEWLRRLDPPPDVLHVHDWQAALAPAFLRGTAPLYPELAAVRTLLTVHNLAYQGRFGSDTWPLLNLDTRYFAPDWLEFFGQVNYLKAGLVFADKLTTVSPTYAREIVQSPETGAGLEGLLRHRQQDLVGIMNGVDYTRWSPDVDPALPQRYSAQDLSGKAADKAALQRELGLDVDENALLTAAIGRLAHQKGYDLLAQALPRMLDRKLQFVLLGMGDSTLEQEFRALAERHPTRVSVQIRFDDALAHRIEGGADVFLMPSRFEPCGLNQLYSLRYGTLPVVHAVGGLNDSIREGAEGWGFRFDNEDLQGLLAAVDRALTLWSDRSSWRSAMQRAMARDHSWDRAAEQYEALYRG